MKRLTLYFLILILPFLAMILVNELVRLSSEKHEYNINGTASINSNLQIQEKCTWACYHNTTFCKQNHVKFLKGNFKYSDPLYFGLIKKLGTTGNYSLANILLLVIIAPLLIYFLLINTIELKRKLNALKKR